MTSSKRVLITGMTSNRGGVEAFLYNYVSYLVGTVKFDFWCNNESCAFEEELRQLGCGVFHGTSYGASIRKARADMLEFFEEHASDYDALWCNASMLVHIDELRFAKRYDIPKIILHSHNSHDMFSGVGGLIKACLHRVNRHLAYRLATDYWACSEEAAEYFFTPRNHSSQRYRFVPNAIDTTAFAFNQSVRDMKRKELGVADDAAVIGFVGRLDYQKDPELMIRIFDAFHARHHKSILLVVGDGILRDKCEAMIADSGLSSHVKFLGRRSDTAQLYQAMDVFCLPSRFEGLSVAAVEAQCSGLPCVIADTLSRKTAVTPLFTTVSREAPIEEWTRAIAEALHLGKRFDMSKSVQTAGFEIVNAATVLGQCF